MIKYKCLLTAAFGVLFFTGLAVAEDVINQEVVDIDAAAMSQGESSVTDKISSDFTDLAGSLENSGALVTGLRHGGDIKLDDGNGGTVLYTPPRGKMGYGNIKIALALTENQVGENPATDQVVTALDEILQARAGGKGWGNIAKDRGVTVGQLMGKADKGLVHKPIRSEKSAKTLRVEKFSKQLEVARPGKLERPHRPDRPEKPHKPDRPGRG